MGYAGLTQLKSSLGSSADNFYKGVAVQKLSQATSYSKDEVARSVSNSNKPGTYEGISQKFTETAKPIESFKPINGSVVSVDFPRGKLLKRIREIAEYKDGWSGEEDSVAASKKALDEAENFLSFLPLDRIHSPRISLAADGEINFNWKISTGIVTDLGFYGTGVYSFYSRGPSGEEHFANKVPVDKGLSSIVLELLARKNG